MAKNITIEELAEMTQREFLASRQRFDERFDGLEQKVDGLDRKVDGLEQRVDHGFRALAEILDGMRQDLHDIKIAQGPLVRTMSALEGEVQNLRTRLERVEHKLGIK